jgi:3-oxoacyl-[acyl-carrier protein] reductase
MDTVVVTGASRGIGRYIAEALAREHRVIGLARSDAAVPGVQMRRCDVALHEEVKKAFSDLRRDASVYGLINAAGIASMNLALTTPPETARAIVETNLLGTIYCCQALAPAMIRGGRGRIVNFSTIAVPLGLKGESVYVASKAGVEGFSRAFAREMAEHGVTVNCIAPGPVDTALTAKVPRAQIEALVAQQVIPRQASPQDVLDIVRLILSGSSGMLSGEVLHVGGA